MARKSLEWHVCEADTEREWRKLTVHFADQDAGGSPPEATRGSSKTHYLYELICGIALLCGVVVYLLWQQAEQRIAVIEHEIAALHEEIAAFRQIGVGSDQALKATIQLEYGHNRSWQWTDTHLLQRHNAQSHSLDQVHDMIHQPVGPSDPWLQVSLIAYATANPLIEFILATYGYETLPALLDAFKEHDSWESLAPALFHLAADEFQAQWHTYLRVHYPIPG